MQETQVQSLGREDPLEEEMANHCSILAWRIPWTEEPGGLQFMGSQSRTWLSDWAQSGMIVREGALCLVGNTLTHTQLVGKPITAGLKSFFMKWFWEGKPFPTEPGLLNEVNHEAQAGSFLSSPQAFRFACNLHAPASFPFKRTGAGLVSAECCYKSGGREKGMLRSGAGGVGHGGDHWPAGRSPGVFPLQGVASALSAAGSQEGSPGALHSSCNKRFLRAELCQGPAWHWETKQNQTQPPTTCSHWLPSSPWQKFQHWAD